MHQIIKTEDIDTVYISQYPIPNLKNDLSEASLTYHNSPEKEVQHLRKLKEHNLTAKRSQKSLYDSKNQIKDLLGSESIDSLEASAEFQELKDDYSQRILKTIETPASLRQESYKQENINRSRQINIQENVEE